MKKILFVFVLLSGIIICRAQEGKETVLGVVDTAMKEMEKKKEEGVKHWTYKGMVGLNASQTGFWNWAAGGENSVAGNLYLNAGVYYQNGSHSWDTDLATEYGLVYSQAYEGTILTNGKDVRNSRGIRKNMDKFELSTKYGYELAKSFYIATIADLKTQFDNGFQYGADGVDPNGVATTHTEDLTSAFFSPAYSNISVGIDYKRVPGLTLYLSPVAGKFTVVMKESLRTSYGVDLGKVCKPEFGAYFKAGCNYNLGKNKAVNIKSSLDLFTSYLNSPFRKIDVNWDVFVGIKVAKYFSVTLSTSLKYDDDVLINGVNSKVQFKEVLGLGVSYSL